MLGYIRESIQGWIAAIIIGILIVPFALWGINKYFGPAGSQVVATVNGEEILSVDYQNAFYTQRDRMRQIMGASFDADRMEKSLRKQALDTLIERELLKQAADKAGFGVTMENVKAQIKSFDVFQQDGKYSHDLYLRALQSQGKTPAQFENDMQGEMLTRQIYTAINSTDFATSREVEQLQKLQAQTRDIEYLVAPLSNFKDEKLAADEAIQTYYDNHKAEYMTPEMVSLSYIELDAKKLDIKVEPSEDELKKFYEERKSQYELAEERRTSHILITVDEGADEAAISAAKKKAEEIKAKLDKGAKFEELAKQYSQDPGSKNSGGDIGFFGKGSLDPNYEKTMYALKKDEISDPVLSKFGFHIIKVTDIHAAKSKSLEEVKGDILAELKADAANKKFFELSDKLTNLAYEVPDSLQDAAGAIDAKIVDTPMFARFTGTGIAANPKVSAAAFSDDVLNKGYNSEPIELGPNHVVVIRVKDHKQKQQKPLDTVKDQIKSKVINDAARKKVEQVAKDILEKMRSAASAEAAKGEAAKEFKAVWKKQDKLTRGDSKVDRSIVSKVFKTKKPEAGKPSYDMVQLANGDVAIFAVNKVEDGDVSKLDEAKKTSSKRSLSSISSNELFEQYLNALKAEADIVKFEDRL